MSHPKSAVELERFAPFQQLSATGKALLGSGLRYAQFGKTTTVLKKGQKISGAYVVMAGRLRVFTLSPDGNEATLYLIDPGETCVLALNCIFNDLLYPAWVEAAPGTRVAIVAGASYRILFESEPAIRSVTVQALATVVARLMTELEQIHSYKLEQRLASFLVTQARDGSVSMTQQEIASHLGTTREVIARVVRRLVRAGYIATRRGGIAIDNGPGLAALARPAAQARPHDASRAGVPADMRRKARVRTAK